MTETAARVARQTVLAANGEPVAGRDAAAPLLAISGLEVTFRTRGGDIPAVRGVDLSIGRGEIVALVGESGSGKSTIGNALMRLFDQEVRVHTSGQALYRDRRGFSRDLLHLSEREMRRIRGAEIGMIFQEPLSSLNPIYTVGSQIVEAIRAHWGVSRAEARARALELLEVLGLPSPARCLASYPHQISGGMRQRVTIAIALACEPSLLIADEPTTALDVTIQAQIIDLLQAVQARTGMAILFITHDLGLVAEMADRVLVMYAGQIVEAAPVDEVFRAPLMPYTKALMEAIPELGCSSIPGYRLDPISGQSPNPLRLPTGCAFHPRCPFCEPPRCTGPVPPLEAAGDARHVRCVRWHELDLEGTG